MSEEQKTVKKDVQMKLVLDEEVITFSREYTYIYVSFCLVCGNLHTIWELCIDVKMEALQLGLSGCILSLTIVVGPAGWKEEAELN